MNVAYETRSLCRQSWACVYIPEVLVNASRGTTLSEVRCIHISFAEPCRLQGQYRCLSETGVCPRMIEAILTSGSSDTH